MIKKLLFGLFILIAAAVHAETIKTDVLVLGGTPGGLATAMQSARSKVKTILVMQEAWLTTALPASGMISLTANHPAPAGLLANFYKKVTADQKNKLTDTSRKTIVQVEASAVASILKKMSDTVKNLTIKTNATWSSVKREGEGWEVIVTVAGKTEIIKARVLVDATANEELLAKIGAKFAGGIASYTDVKEEKLYRTSIACTMHAPAPQGTPAFIPLKALLVKDAGNLLVIGPLIREGSNGADLAWQLTVGQGAGCTAAYCAFFKTTTKNLKVRVIQGELLDFGGELLPFADLTPADHAWRAVQQVCATGLLKGILHGDDFNFDADATVSTAEVRPVLCEIYTRGFLWFSKEIPGEQFTVGNLLSFISELSLTDPQVLQNSVQKAWKKQYQFKQDFDLKRPVTRREFAVLANKYLNPFARTVDLDGRLVN
jgi:ribulose 1,5-bisphosphate synthetase/thiazole synthase